MGQALLLDLYELTMAQSYFDQGLHERPATFSLFVRRLPPGWGYLVAAGLEAALEYLETLSFQDDDLSYLEEKRLFTPAFLGFLARLRFSGEVRALSEGTLFFPDEPVLEVTAPMVEAQLAETLLLNQIQLQSLVASKAARCVDAAAGRALVDFGLRRAHGTDAGLALARSSYLAGFDSTSNVLASRRYGIPLAGTMAHSYVQAFADELTAFRAFAHSYPDDCTLLVDTYDVLAGARNAAVVARELQARGHRLQAVRLDSGDLLDLSRQVRTLLNDEGLPEVAVFASGSLDEAEIERLLANGAPIDGFGVGTKLATSADAPYLDVVYKLAAFDGRPVLKLSVGKETWPGAKQVWRVRDAEESFFDTIGLSNEDPPAGGMPLLEVAMAGGHRLGAESLEGARERCAEQRELFRRPREIRFSAGLISLRDEVAGH
jgi:nicotinate phosphoribosyltransferase